MLKCRPAMVRLPLLALGASMWLVSLPQNQAAAGDVEINLSSKDREAIPAFKPTSWSGLYFGGNLGYEWTSVDATDNYAFAGNPTASTTGSFAGSGFLGGVQAGYNFQKSSLVYGLEADLGYLNLSGSSSRTLPVGANSLLSASYSAQSGLYGDVTARGGLAVGRFLFYLKGGLALLDTELSANYNGSTTSYVGCLLGSCFLPTTTNSHSGFKDSGILWGWTAGVGGEYSLTQSLSAKLEYQHFDFGSGSVSHSGSSTSSGHTSTIGGNASFSPTIDVVKVGINYHLNAGSE
jgi:outer membrane immunogenic protein